MAEGIMSLLFGKKRRRRTSKKSTKGKVSRKKIGYAIKKNRIVNVFKFKGLKGRRYASKNKLAKGKKVYKTKAAAKRSMMKKQKKKTTRRRTKRSSFGVGGSYMPLESFMSPYPYSVDSSPPWI